MDVSDKKVQFPEPKPTEGRIAAETRLLFHLSEAMKLVSERGPHTRDGIMEAIEAVMIFLDKRGVSGQQIWPFGLLRDELDAIFEGKRSLILQPSIETQEDLPGTRFTGPGKKHIRLFAAACAEAVYRLGGDQTDRFPKRRRSEADGYVARHMSKWPAFDRGSYSARTIKGWRDQIIEEAERAKFKSLVAQFTRNEEGRRHLLEVIRNGPPHIGGFQPP